VRVAFYDLLNKRKHVDAIGRCRRNETAIKEHGYKTQGEHDRWQNLAWGHEVSFYDKAVDAFKVREGGE
jgi:hypothetical protein